MGEPFRIAVSGYYGFGNAGDEAVLAGIAQALRERTVPGGSSLTVLSGSVHDTETRHGLPAVDRMHIPTLRRLFHETGLLLSGGGSLLQDVTSVRSLLYYVWVMRLAHRCGCPTVFCAQGIGPLRRRVSRVMVRIAANHARAITVRDPESAALLRRIGVRERLITVTADPAFALKPDTSDFVDKLLERMKIDTRRPILGIAVRPWHEDGWTDERLERCVQAAAGAFDGTPLFIPMQPSADLPLSTRLAGTIPGAAAVTEELTPSQHIALLGRCRMTLAMRLHALIFAAAAGTPPVALSYDPKVDQMMLRLGLSQNTIPLKSAEPSVTADVLQGVESRRRETTERLVRASSPLREAACRNIDLALRAVGRSDLLLPQFQEPVELPEGETCHARRTLEDTAAPTAMEQTR
jgi:polysaccharide pyruvyl transferase CsaB